MPEIDPATRDMLRSLVGGHVGLRQLLDELVARHKERGSFPSARRWRCQDDAERAAILSLFTPRAAHPAPDDPLVLKLDLGRFAQVVAEDYGVDLATLLYAALGGPDLGATTELTDPEAGGVVAAPIVDQVSGAIARAAVSAPDDEAAQAWLAAERDASARGGGVLAGYLGGSAPEAFEGEALTVAKVVAAVRANSGPMRLGKFARRTLGLASELRVESPRYRAATDALIAFDPDTSAFVADEGAPTPEQRRVAALARWGIYPDGSTPQALAFGPITFEKRGRTLDQLLAHAKLGEAAVLTLEQLQGAAVSFHDFDRITCLQRHGAFFDYVERVATRRGRELVICADGSTNWAVILLLRVAFSARPSAEVRYSGDLTVTGALALDRLSRRCGVPLAPWLMDPATLYKHKADAVPLYPGEADTLATLLADPQAPCRPLLEAIERVGYGVLQDAVADGEF